MSQETFFRTRALEAREDAAATELPNVRERCLRAAAAWEVMADRELRVMTAREKRDAEKSGPAMFPEAGAA